MLKINVEAFPDESRPRGGYAVILLRGVSNIPPQPTIRLKPIDGGMDGSRHRTWIGEQIVPVATRLTEQGIQIVVGPEVVGNPHLLTGTPVMIEIPAANVRGEFVWPNVIPLALPRRRHMSGSRRPRNRPVFNEQVFNEQAFNEQATAEPVQIVAEPTEAKVVPIKPALNGAAHRIAQDAPAAIETAIQPLDERPQDVPADAVAPADTMTPPVEAAPVSVHAEAPADPSASVADTAGPAPADDLKWQPSALARDRRLWLLVAGLALVSMGLSGLLHMVGARQAGNAAPRPAAGSNAAAAATHSATAAAAKTDGGGAAASAPAGKRGGNSGGGAPGGPNAAALAPAAASAAAPAAPCGKAEVATEPLDAGMMRIRITSACRAGQDVHVAYGGADLVRRLDATGSLDMTLDCFAGDSTPVELKLKDGEHHAIPVAAKDIGRVSKVAVVWRAPVNLDLHVFEYASALAQKGHLWAKAASTLEGARAEIAAEGRGHGFLGTLADATGAGDKLEVYTFLHHDEAPGGIVTFALDHETRGGRPKETTCGQGALAEVPFSISTLSRTGKLVRESGILARTECGGTLTEDARYQPLPAPVLKISR